MKRSDQYTHQEIKVKISHKMTQTICSYSFVHYYQTKSNAHFAW